MINDVRSNRSIYLFNVLLRIEPFPFLLTFLCTGARGDKNKLRVPFTTYCGFGMVILLVFNHTAEVEKEQISYWEYFYGMWGGNVHSILTRATIPITSRHLAWVAGTKVLLYIWQFQGSRSKIGILSLELVESRMLGFTCYTFPISLSIANNCKWYHHITTVFSCRLESNHRCWNSINHDE